MLSEAYQFTYFLSIHSLLILKKRMNDKQGSRVTFNSFFVDTLSISAIPNYMKSSLSIHSLLIHLRRGRSDTSRLMPLSIHSLLILLWVPALELPDRPTFNSFFVDTVRYLTLNDVLIIFFQFILC